MDLIPTQPQEQAAPKQSFLGENIRSDPCGPGCHYCCRNRLEFGF